MRNNARRNAGMHKITQKGALFKMEPLCSVVDSALHRARYNTYTNYRFCLLVSVEDTQVNLVHVPGTAIK